MAAPRSPAAPAGPSALAGRAFRDLSAWRRVAVSGRDAGEWLDDLVSADLSGLATGEARPSLLLTPTGRIRAAFTVARLEHEFLLIQDPVQPRSVEVLLAPYVLSSDVALEDRTDAVALVALPGAGALPELPVGVRALRPSCLGDGIDLVAAADDRDALLAALGDRLGEASEQELESWRVAAGIPRFGVDGGEDDLPQEAGLERAVSFDKGCYLGQEAVAKVRNLGHPRRLLLALEATGAAGAGEPIRAGEREVGRVTSAVPAGDRTLVLATVRWDARDLPLQTAGGVALLPRVPGS